MKRKIFALLLTVLLVSVLALSASADAYVPPKHVEGFDMRYAYMEDGNCKALNTFLSNFVEIDLSSYSQETRDDAVIAYVLKHLEINAGYYPSDVKKVTGDDGETYMKISESIFEKRMQRLFARNIPAEQCPGYENGKITVTAAHFGGPIQVFASVYACYPMSDEVFDVYFEVFYVEKDFSGWYSTAHSNLPQEKLISLGSGSALVKYAGGKTNETISTADFALMEYSMDADGIPCAGANVPYGYEEPTQPETEPETEPATQPETEPETQPETVPVTEPDLLPAPENQKEDMAEEEEPSEDDFQDTQPKRLTLILVSILVAAVVLLALILLFFFVILKKKP